MLLDFSILHELEDELTKEELDALENEIYENLEEYNKAIDEYEKKLTEEAELAHEAQTEAQIALMESPEYIAYSDSLTPPINYFKIRKEILTRKTLIFGLNKNPSGTVTTLEWELFKKEHITPLFPGFTEIPVKGYWEGQPENSMELVIACEDNFVNDNKINKIMKTYNQQFDQDCVMKTNADNTVEFYEKR